MNYVIINVGTNDIMFGPKTRGERMRQIRAITDSVLRAGYTPIVRTKTSRGWAKHVRNAKRARRP